jgi:hypothetical protein
MIIVCEGKFDIILIVKASLNKIPDNGMRREAEKTMTRNRGWTNTQ